MYADARRQISTNDLASVRFLSLLLRSSNYNRRLEILLRASHNNNMAQIALPTFQQDDFILTLPDDELGVESYEDEEGISVTTNATSTQKHGQKRKRKSDIHADEGTERLGKKPRSKNDERIRGHHQLENEDVSRAGKDLQAQVEDDGAIDSDFEFVNGDGTTGVLEDFDGWDRESPVGTSGDGGSKAGLGIEEIIARRRRAHATKEEHEDKSEDDQAIEGSQDVQQQDRSAEDGFDGFEGTEDELLAEDAFGMGAPPESGSELEDSIATGEQEQEDEVEEEDISDGDSVASPVPHPEDMGSDTSGDDDGEVDSAEAARRQAFFAPEDRITNKTESSKTRNATTFQTMSLSRPVLRGLAAVGFSAPTPIQTKTIPVALLGKDVVGGAVTGSGKTAAFLVPIIERLLYRPKRLPTSRVAILMPTRELAMQCYNVAKKLASYTDISFCYLVGGFSLREQENELRKRPDVIIATPGRFIDHMRNSSSFTLDTLEILVLDEADRMLEDGFADELNEILTTIPKSRQTMLFSATMTNSVDKLIRVGMTRPVRLMIDARKQTVQTLVQEFVRLRPGREDKRLAYLMHLCENVHTNRVIVFFRQKREAHRVRILFGLCGFEAAELHGSMSQEQVSITFSDSFRRVHYGKFCKVKLMFPSTENPKRRGFPRWSGRLPPGDRPRIPWARHQRRRNGHQLRGASDARDIPSSSRAYGSCRPFWSSMYPGSGSGPESG